jgi:hypothetical protein
LGTRLVPLTAETHGGVPQRCSWGGEYRISTEEPDVIDTRWIFSDSKIENGGAIGSGRARGDTSNGFPGYYRVQYFDTNG